MNNRQPHGKDYGAVTQHPYEDEDLRLWRWLHETRHAIHRARTKELRKYKINTVQSHVMFIILALGDKATPTQIGRYLFRESNSISELLKRMQKDGLIRKFRDLRKRSMIRLELTDKGLRAHNKTTGFESIHDIISVLSEEERKHLLSSLEKLWYRALDELGMERKLPFPDPDEA